MYGFQNMNFLIDFIL